MAGASITLRGRCRCGKVLSFTLTAAGYKRVCPRCRSVVRLNPKQREQKRRSPAAPPQAARETSPLRCSCGQEIRLQAGNSTSLVVCPACQQAVQIRAGGKSDTDPRTKKTVELSPSELAELAHELSAVTDGGAATAAKGSRAGGWEKGLRACQACGELLGLGSDVCRSCGTANA
jgi:phage FluMu protein Com